MTKQATLGLGIGLRFDLHRISLQGINVVTLWSASMMKGYGCLLWLTLKQAIELGGHVRKGETGEYVVYANSITRTETDVRADLRPPTPGDAAIVAYGALSYALFEQIHLKCSPAFAG